MPSIETSSMAATRRLQTTRPGTKSSSLLPFLQLWLSLTDRVCRFFADRVHARKIEAEKISLRISNQRNLIQKLKKLVTEMESGEAVHVVDFEQMKIENCQLLDQIQEKNEELVKLKLSTSKTIQVCSIDNNLPDS